ncbi:MAG: GWxTD domain-containing protein [Candidatus Aminicenantes bacterium]|nr:GWxTD domain-containing protein [Candidatus Aminicenantes bacterium]
MKKCLSILITLIFIFFSFALAEKNPAEELPPKYKKWLEEEVVYVISPLEKDVFLQLQTDRERGLFIEAFWNHRDPTLGTPDNEFKTEHYRRISYANRYFARGVPKPGWKTDRGRMYILLGEPTDIERIIGETQIYNTEIWFYQGLAKYGLPPGFNLAFYQKGGTGEYVLYSPTSDGPQALMTSFFGDQTNYLRAFRALRKINPNLARVSLSLIPGESTRSGRPSLSSDILLQNIGRLPQKQFEDKYAAKFLLYKDIVEVEYSANYIDNDHLVRVLKDPSGFYFVHYNMEIKKFSLQSYQDKYVTHLKINVNISDLERKTIYQYEGSIPFELNETQVKNLTYNPFSLYDMFPLIAGDYKISVLLKNEVSKEFTSLEQDITVPEEESVPRMSSLILGYKVERKDPSTPRPFQLVEKQVFCQPQNIFRIQDKMFVCYQLLGLDADSLQKCEVRYEILKEDEKVLSLTKKTIEYENTLSINEEFSFQDFEPGYYQIAVTLRDGERDILSEKNPFEITSLSRIPRPWAYSKTLLPLSHPVYSFIIGTQLFNKGKIDQARVQLEKAHKSQPDSVDYSLSLARVYFALNDFENAKAILLAIQESPESNYGVYWLLGKSHQSLSEFDKAITVYDHAISHFGINVNLLNSLGDCYQALGKTAEALMAWNKSLEINPDQPEIKEKVDSVKKIRNEGAL